jgi:hypothetical protein
MPACVRGAATGLPHDEKDTGWAGRLTDSEKEWLATVTGPGGKSRVYLHQPGHLSEYAANILDFGGHVTDEELHRQNRSRKRRPRKLAINARGARQSLTSRI